MARSNVIGIGIIGTGFARTTQIPAFKACGGVRLVAIASAHRENAERVAREFGIGYVAGDWRELVARDDVDLVSIVTPPLTHKEMTLAALDAGKAVLCEKPTAMNTEESLAMLRRAEEKNAFALIDHELRFLTGRRRARELILSGELGRVRHAKLIWRSDARASQERAWDWWSDAKSGGGALGAIGSHAIDGFRWLLCAEIKELFCSLATHVRERPDKTSGKMRRVTSDDEANLILRFEDSDLTAGATGTISLSVVESGALLHRLEIFCERGALRIEESGELWRAETGAGAWQRVEVERSDLAPCLREGGWSRGFTAFAREIVKALQEGRTTVEGAATFEDGHHIQLALDAARRSNESGCWESASPES